MAVENGEWIMYGMDWDDPYRIRSYRELINRINEIGFLPLFKNEIEGFSVEEHTSNLFWWTDDPAQDPWKWREIIARSGEVAYGKFFGKKAGFVSLDWLPAFANYRRDGYDFDSLWEDGLASHRSKKIMDCFEAEPEYSSTVLKQVSGFGKGGENNFSGIVTDLQMQTYLVIKDFRRKRSKSGREYGMPISIYAKPEELWGYDLVASGYKEKPAVSRDRILAHIRALYPQATEQQILKVMK